MRLDGTMGFFSLGSLKLNSDNSCVDGMCVARGVVPDSISNVQLAYTINLGNGNSVMVEVLV